MEENKSLKDVTISAAHFLDTRNQKKIEMLKDVYPLPETGRIIIFNEIERAHDNGKPPKGDRGIAKVVAYYKNIVLLELYRMPSFREKRTVRIYDIRIGLVQYKYMTDYLFMSQFSYTDLSLLELHEDIKRLIDEPKEVELSESAGFEFYDGCN